METYYLLLRICDTALVNALALAPSYFYFQLLFALWLTPVDYLELLLSLCFTLDKSHYNRLHYLPTRWGTS